MAVPRKNPFNGIIHYKPSILGTSYNIYYQFRFICFRETIFVVVKIYPPVGQHQKKIWYNIYIYAIVHFVHSLGFVTIPRNKVTAEWRGIKKGVLDYWGITCVERIVIHRCHQPGGWPNYTMQPKGFVCVKPFFCIWRSTFGNGWTKTTSQLLFGCLTLP
jgi:hypothetical protein